MSLNLFIKPILIFSPSDESNACKKVHRPKDVIYDELTIMKHPVDHPEQSFKGVCKRDLKFMEIDRNTWGQFSSVRLATVHTRVLYAWSAKEIFPQELDCRVILDDLLGGIDSNQPKRHHYPPW